MIKLNHKHPFHLVVPSIWPFFIFIGFVCLICSFSDLGYCEAPTNYKEWEREWKRIITVCWAKVAGPFLTANPDMKYVLKTYLFQLEMQDVRAVISWFHDKHYLFVHDPGFDTLGCADEFCSKINKIRIDLIGKQVSPDDWQAFSKAYKLYYLLTTECIKIGHPDLYYAMIRHVNVDNVDILYTL